jgi:mannosyltransferase OCH1-like enzyme
MIPSILWQSWKTKQIPRAVKPLADSWKFSNPNLKNMFMDDTECSDFILKYFGSVIHQQYLSFPQNIMRADFWRVAVVYIHGGYYSDLDVECNVNLSTIIDNHDTIDCVFIKELDNIANFFFGCTPKHPILKNTLDMMLENSKNINNLTAQDFGMHPLHQCVRDYYNVVGTNYVSNNQVYFLDNEKMKTEKKLIHIGASGFDTLGDYESWRHKEVKMHSDRENSCDILFFTTFNKNGYELYGQEWIKSFIAVANYYNKFKAKIYYEGFTPTVEHPSISWIKYEDTITEHPEWKRDYLAKTKHADYVKTMTIRFSHKAFVIQHALQNNSNDYIIWLDGDCVFKPSDYTNFPKKILSDKLLACQVEHNNDLNHVESGILIFNGKHKDKMTFVNVFKQCYDVDNIVEMGQPYDGFLIFKTLLLTQLKYIDLNEKYGKGGIQSDPNMTFCHPELQTKFIHNIGWTGKTQYDKWDDVFKNDDIYKVMKNALFSFGKDESLNLKKQNAFNMLQKLNRVRL